MRARRPLYRQGTALVVLLACLAGAGRAAADAKEEERLRDQALQLNEITGQDAILGQLVALLDDKAKDSTRKLLKVAYQMARDGDKEKDKDPVFNINATFLLARAAHSLQENDIGEYFYRQYAKQAVKFGSGVKIVRAYTGLIEVLLQAKKFAEAEKVCQEILETPGSSNSMKMLALRQMALVLTKKGKIDQALKMIDIQIKVADRRVGTWPEAVVERILLRDLKGRVLREAGKFGDSALVWEDLLDILAKDKELKESAKEDFADEIRYRLSGVYVDLKQIDKATKHLETLLAKEKDNPTYNNDLGFIWADNDMNLEQAEKLIRRALDEDRKLRRKATPDLKPEEDKDNAAYLDSLGWVLFKRKKYKEALPPLLEAIKQKEGQHVEIFDHLGDVYVALGEKDKAIEAWKKGVKCDPVTKRDQQRKADVEKKIKKFQEK
jgi:tetratricopeptide (TPR) repeat protein